MMFSILNMDFADRVKERMKALRLSSVELAQVIGVSKGSITHWTNGTNQASGKRLIALANALECSAEWLATGTEPGPDHKGRSADGAESMPVPAKSVAAAMVLDMLNKHAGKSLNSAAQQRIAQAVADSLADQHVVAERPNNVIPADFSRNHPRKGELLIPQFDIRASLGAGQVPTDYVETVRNVIVNEAHLQALGIKYTAVENISLVTGWGDSMEGTINDKDPVMIDHGVKEFIGDGLYLLTWLDHLYIKRVAVMDAEHFKLKSDNEKYDPQVARIDDVTIHARVLLIWNTRKA